MCVQQPHFYCDMSLSISVISYVFLQAVAIYVNILHEVYKMCRVQASGTATKGAG